MFATLGSFTFEVSSERTKTFRDLRLSHSVSFAEHKVIGKKGVVEFTGLNASSASLSLTLSASFGVNPAQEISELYSLMNSHELLVFSLGGQVVGSGYWVIEGLDEEDRIIDSHGNITEATVSVKLKECDL